MPIEVWLKEGEESWELIADGDVVTFCRNGLADPTGNPENQFSIPRSELGRRVEPLIGAFWWLLRVDDGSKKRAFEPSDMEAWRTLAGLFAEQRRSVLLRMLKFRGHASSAMGLASVGEFVFSWSSFLIPVAALMALLWLAIFVVRRASILLALGVFFLLAGVSEGCMVYLWGAPGWFAWTLPVLLFLVGFGHLRGYGWLRWVEPPTRWEPAIAITCGLLGMGGIGLWAHLVGWFDVLDLWLAEGL